jgi:O6-methylguanine-DNA--protein-cysteine methyltransferase
VASCSSLTRTEISRRRFRGLREPPAKAAELVARQGACTIATGTVPEAIERDLSGYFGGDIDAITSIPTVASGTAFQESVWTVLRSISPGSPLTYADLAIRLAKPARSAPWVTPTAPISSASSFPAIALSAHPAG